MTIKGLGMKPNDLRLINELIYDKQQLGFEQEAILESMVKQLQYVVDQIKDNEPPILYFDDEGQPINGIEPNGYAASEDELMSWDEIIDRGLF